MRFDASFLGNLVQKSVLSTLYLNIIGTESFPFLGMCLIGTWKEFSVKHLCGLERTCQKHGAAEDS